MYYFEYKVPTESLHREKQQLKPFISIRETKNLSISIKKNTNLHLPWCLVGTTWGQILSLNTRRLYLLGFFTVLRSLSLRHTRVICRQSAYWTRSYGVVENFVKEPEKNSLLCLFWVQFNLKPWGSRRDNFSIVKK